MTHVTCSAAEQLPSLGVLWLKPLVPSGKHTKNYGQSPFSMGKAPFLMGKSAFSMGKSTISMAIFNSFLYVYQAG